MNLPSPSRQTSVAAVVSLIFGILGWTLVPFIGSIVAIVSGHMARSQIRQAQGSMDGDGLAVAGLVMGYLMIGLAIFSVIAIIMLFGGLAAFIAMFGN
jgi:hypothetical protein